MQLSAHAASRQGECVRVQNVVATFSLGRDIPLVLFGVALGGRSAPAVFPSSVTRSTDTATASSIFNTGRTVEVGCKTEMHARLAAHMLVWEIKKHLNITCSVINFRISNVVCRVELESNKKHTPGHARSIVPRMCD